MGIINQLEIPHESTFGKVEAHADGRAESTYCASCGEGLRRIGFHSAYGLYRHSEP